MAKKIAQQDIRVPDMGESVTEATLAKWLCNEGDRVEADQPVAELETDKVTVEVPAPAAGILDQVQVQPGESVSVGALLAYISPGEPAKKAAPAQKEPEAVTQKQAEPTNQQPILFPAAQKAAAEHGIAPQSGSGTGKGGRITKNDVLKQAASIQAPPAPQTEIRVPMSRLRQKIAERLKSAQNTAAILTTFNEIDMSHVIDLRSKFKELFEKKHGVKLGFMSFFVQACVRALKEFPAVNAEIQGNDLVYKNHYDIGVAVGTPQGLVVPIVRQADQLSFAQIEKEIGSLGTKARDGKLTLEDLSGGTFTISNGGVYGSLMSTPILNPPQSGILGMHKTQNRPIAVGNTIEIRPMMYVALSYDHRIIDGREAVTFLLRIKECLEDPERLMLEI